MTSRRSRPSTKALTLLTASLASTCADDVLSKNATRAPDGHTRADRSPGRMFVTTNDLSFAFPRPRIGFRAGVFCAGFRGKFAPAFCTRVFEEGRSMRHFNKGPVTAFVLAAAALLTQAISAQAPAKTGARTITFPRDVAPIVQRSCQNCHRPDSMAPMSFLTYEEIGRAHV